MSSNFVLHEERFLNLILAEFNIVIMLVKFSCAMERRSSAVHGLPFSRIVYVLCMVGHLGQ
jgi:hypothetical protein